MPSIAASPVQCSATARARPKNVLDPSRAAATFMLCLLLIANSIWITSSYNFFHRFFRFLPLFSFLDLLSVSTRPPASPAAVKLFFCDAPPVRPCDWSLLDNEFAIDSSDQHGTLYSLRYVVLFFDSCSCLSYLGGKLSAACGVMAQHITDHDCHRIPSECASSSADSSSH